MRINVLRVVRTIRKFQAHLEENNLKIHTYRGSASSDLRRCLMYRVEDQQFWDTDSLSLKSKGKYHPTA